METEAKKKYNRKTTIKTFEIKLNKRNLGLSQRDLKLVTRSLVQNIVLTSKDKKIITWALSIQNKVNQGKGYSAKTLAKLQNNASTVRTGKSTRAGMEKTFLKVDTRNQKMTKQQLHFSNARLSNKALKNAVAAGSISQRVAKNLKALHTPPKPKRPRVRMKPAIDVSREKVADVIRIVDGMGGIAEAMAKYKEDVERLSDRAEIEVKQLIDFYEKK